ncbi:MAG: hypothetical protein KDJ15_02220 [Alphaproteobacteria bacterium]|nr:hypothetical protein [Alphaproteobacteria bacterium]
MAGYPTALAQAFGGVSFGDIPLPSALDEPPLPKSAPSLMDAFTSLLGGDPAALQSASNDPEHKTAIASLPTTKQAPTPQIAKRYEAMTGADQNRQQGATAEQTARDNIGQIQVARKDLSTGASPSAASAFNNNAPASPLRAFAASMLTGAVIGAVLPVPGALTALATAASTFRAAASANNNNNHIYYRLDDPTPQRGAGSRQRASDVSAFARTAPAQPTAMGAAPQPLAAMGLDGEKTFDLSRFDQAQLDQENAQMLARAEAEQRVALAHAGKVGDRHEYVAQHGLANDFDKALALSGRDIGSHFVMRQVNGLAPGARFGV